MKGLRTIASRATYRRRKDYYVPADTLPFLTSDPSVAATLVTHPATNESGLFAFVGDTVTATPGVWDDPDGTPTVTGQWVDADNTPVAAADAVNLVIPAASPGDIFVWRETAVQAGKTAIHFHPQAVVVVEPVVLPTINSYAPITGGNSPGDTLTKPAFTWNPASGLTIAGQWVKNGTPTGVTASTYNSTADGDEIIWRETATNEAEQSATWDSVVFLVTDTATALAAIMADEIDALIDGKTGGDTQDLYPSHDSTLSYAVNHANLNFVKNDDFFAPDLYRQLSGVAMWKSEYGQYLAYTAITPRHVIGCAHGSMTWADLWFVREDGVMHQNRVQWVAHDGSSSKPNSTTRVLPQQADLQVGRLTADLPDWVTKYPVIAMSAQFEQRLYAAGNPPTLYVSQGDATPVRFPNAPDIWTLHGPKLCVAAMNHYELAGAQRLLFKRYPLVNGDSGHPEFILANGHLHLLRTFTGAGGSGPNIGTYKDYVNSLIARVDAAAGSATGYTLNIASVPGAEPEPLLTADSSMIELSGGYHLTRTI